jgi:hypothetical protein
MMANWYEQQSIGHTSESSTTARGMNLPFGENIEQETDAKFELRQLCGSTGT